MQKRSRRKAAATLLDLRLKVQTQAAAKITEAAFLFSLFLSFFIFFRVYFNAYWLI